MERLKALLQEQFRQSPWAKPMLILFGILVGLYVLFPPPKAEKVKKNSLMKKGTPKVEIKKNNEKRNGQNGAVNIGKGDDTTTPLQQPKVVQPAKPEAPKAAGDQTHSSAGGEEKKGSTEQPVAQIGTLHSLVMTSPRGAKRKTDPFAPLVKKPQSVPVKNQTPVRPKIRPPIKLPKIAVPIPFPEKGPKVQLKGIVWDASPVAFLKIGDKDVALGVGGRGEGIVVLKIRKNKVWLRTRNGVRVLGIEQ